MTKASTSAITIANFSKVLATWVTGKAKIEKQAHAIAVFALGHAHEHGDCIYLNMFWEKMGPAYQAQFRRYIVATCAVDMTDLSTSWLTMSKNTLIINPEFKGKKRSLFYRKKGEKDVVLEKAAQLADYPPFTVVDPDKVKNPFTDESVLNSLKSLANKVEKQDAKVSPELAQAVKKMSADVINLADRIKTKAESKQAPSPAKADTAEGAQAASA